jgi:hypothetical protein
MERHSTQKAAQKGKNSAGQLKTKRDGLFSKQQGTATKKQPLLSQGDEQGEIEPSGFNPLFVGVAKTNATYVSDQFEALNISYQLGEEIPTIIHRFWSGGPMNENTMKVLSDGATKVKGKEWSNRLWYSSTLEDELFKKSLLTKQGRLKLKEQRDTLKNLGYTVAPIEDLASEIQKEKSPPITKAEIKQFAMSAAQIRVKGKSNDGIKHLSDVARLMYGYHYGGHHFDTDMGLGSMSLEQPYKHNDPKSEVPLMGAVGVVPYDYEMITGQKVGVSINVGTDEGKKAAAKLINAAIETSILLNGMFATRGNNPHIKQALTALAQTYRDGSLSKPGTNLSPIMVYGEVMASDFNITDRSDVKTAIRKMTVPPYILDVQAFTEESANRNAT